MVDGTRELATVITKQDDAILRYDEEEEVKRSTSPAMNDCTVNIRKILMTTNLMVHVRTVHQNSYKLVLYNVYEVT